MSIFVGLPIKYHIDMHGYLIKLDKFTMNKDTRRKHSFF